MTISYTNRRGQTYFLLAGRTKRGRRQCFFSMRQDGKLADAVPPGFEIYEHPDAQVHLRRIPPKIISDEEVAIVERELHRHVRHWLVDRRAEIITVYEADEKEHLGDLLGSLSGLATRAKIEASITRFLRYMPTMQFVLVNRKTRLFQTRRYCYLGSVDDWIDIGAAGRIEVVSKRFIRHVGKESYFDLY